MASQLCSLRSLSRGLMSHTHLASAYNKIVYNQYSNSPFRFNFGFKTHNKRTMTGILLRIGGSMLLAAAGTCCYVYYSQIPSASVVVECRQLPPPLHLNKIPSEGKLTLNEAILSAKDLVERKKIESGCPGIVVAVSIDGRAAWTEGFGYADLENRVPCTSDTVMRIASISKSITMAAVAKMWETGQIDLEKPVQYYLPTFPEKEVDGEKVTITLHHLLSHMSGIRHYDKKYLDKKTDKNNNNDTKKPEASNDNDDNNNNNNNNNNNSENLNENSNSNDAETTTNKKEKDDKFDEFYLKRSFKNVEEALTLFKDDPLVHKPGSKFLYTTHGWTLVSAILEKASNIPLPKLMTSVFKEMGLHHTCLDRNDPIVYNRARFYRNTKNGQIVNVPYVDNSYKWAGGGFLSTVGDLIKFGNAMLYSFQFEEPNDSPTSNTVQEKNIANLKGYLKRKTMLDMWKPVEGAKMSEVSDAHYGLGWTILPDKYEHAFCLKNRFYTCHLGSAVGASSILFILPKESTQAMKNPPKGVVVVALSNLTGVNFCSLAVSIAELFDRVES